MRQPAQNQYALGSRVWKWDSRAEKVCIVVIYIYRVVLVPCRGNYELNICEKSISHFIFIMVHGRQLFLYSKKMVLKLVSKPRLGSSPVENPNQQKIKNWFKSAKKIVCKLVWKPRLEFLKGVNWGPFCLLWRAKLWRNRFGNEKRCFIRLLKGMFEKLFQTFSAILKQKPKVRPCIPVFEHTTHQLLNKQWLTERNRVRG